jgi:hypothetical protein
MLSGNLRTLSSTLVEFLLQLFEMKTRGLQRLGFSSHTNDGGMENILISVLPLTRRPSDLVSTTAITGWAVL